MENKDIGMVIWVGEDRFVQYQVDLQDPEVRATFNDVRSYISVSASVRLFALEFTSRFKVFTVYRHASDRQGRPGFLAVTLLLPYNLTIRNLTGLLDAISLKYYKDHYGLGGVLRTDAPVYEEVYTQELERLLRSDHPVSMVFDEDWTGVPSKQDGKPKVLPYTDIQVVEDFFQTPHRPSFRMSQEVIFVSNAYLDGSQEGMELRNLQQEDLFDLDGRQGVGREVIGLPFNPRSFGLTVSDLAVGGNPVSDEVYLRDGSQIRFHLSKGKFYEDIDFEGPVREAISHRYLVKTEEGYSFDPSIRFTEKSKAVQVQVPCLADSLEVFQVQAVSSRQGAVSRSASLSRDGADFVFKGAEIGDTWDFVVEEHGYAYTLLRGYCPESGDGQVQDLDSRLVTIDNRTGKEVRIVGHTALKPLKKEAIDVSGVWLLPRGLKDYNFQLSFDELYFKQRIEGLEKDAVVLELDRTHYDLRIPRSVWNALERDQRDSLSFSVDGKVFNSVKVGSFGRIPVELAARVREGKLQMEVSHKKYEYDFEEQKIEEKNWLLLKPDVVQVVQGTGTHFKLSDGTLLPPGSTFLPMEIVQKPELLAAGFKVEQVGGGDPSEPSFPCFSRAQDRGERPENAGSGKVLGDFPDPSSGRGRAAVGERSVGHHHSEKRPKRKWLIPFLAGLGVLLAIVGLVLFLVLRNKDGGKDKDVTIRYVVDSRPDLPITINLLSDGTGKSTAKIKGAKVSQAEKNVLVLDTSKVIFPLSLTLEFENEGSKPVTITNNNVSDGTQSVRTPAMDDLEKLCESRGTVDAILRKYPESTFVKEAVEKIQSGKYIVEALETIANRILSMDCRKTTVDSLKTVYLDDASVWNNPGYSLMESYKWYEDLYKFQTILFTEKKKTLNGPTYRNINTDGSGFGFKEKYFDFYIPDQANLIYELVGADPSKKALQDSILGLRSTHSYREMKALFDSLKVTIPSTSTAVTRGTTTSTTITTTTPATSRRGSRRNKRR